MVVRIARNGNECRGDEDVGEDDGVPIAKNHDETRAVGRKDRRWTGRDPPRRETRPGGTGSPVPRQRRSARLVRRRIRVPLLDVRPRGRGGLVRTDAATRMSLECTRKAANGKITARHISGAIELPLDPNTGSEGRPRKSSPSIGPSCSSPGSPCFAGCSCAWCRAWNVSRSRLVRASCRPDTTCVCNPCPVCAWITTAPADRGRIDMTQTSIHSQMRPCAARFDPLRACDIDVVTVPSHPGPVERGRITGVTVHRTAPCAT